jgi:hypothetical protein
LQAGLPSHVNSSAATIFVDLEVWRANGGRERDVDDAGSRCLECRHCSRRFSVQHSVMSRVAASDARFRVCARLYCAAMITTGATAAAVAPPDVTTEASISG